MTQQIYKNLVFKGGGMKIFSSVGAIKILEEEGILENIQNVSGTSAGASLALLVSLNMTAAEIKDFFLNTFDPASEMRFKNEDSIKLETERFFLEFGRYSGKEIQAQLAQVLVNKIGYSDVTFQQLHDLNFKDLYVVATDLTDQKSVIFSYTTTPNASVLEAVRASGAYPLFLTPVITEEGHILVDGGLLNNYPIEIFDTPEFFNGQDFKHNSETLGVFLGIKNETSNYVSKFGDLSKLLAPFNDMSSEVIEQHLKDLNIETFHNTSEDEYNIYLHIKNIWYLSMQTPGVTHHDNGEIFIDNVGSVKTLALDLSYEDRLNLITYGEEAAHLFFYPTAVGG